MTEKRFLSHPDGSNVAFVHLAGTGPGVVFCGGFNSDMQGNKALALERFCREAGRQFTRFDYRGHGISSGKLEEHTISDWLADAELILAQVAEGPQIIVGSSMGGWIACLLIKKQPQRFRGFVSVAGAPDFTEEIMLPGLSEASRAKLAAGETIHVVTEYDDTGYPIRQQLLDDGRQNLVLDTPLAVNFPVRLLHGTGDDSVPWQHSVRLMQTLRGEDIQLLLIKDGDHRLSEPQELREITAAVFKMV